MQEVELPIGVTLEKAYHGAIRHIEVQGEAACCSCGGGGLSGGRTCPAHGGKELFQEMRALRQDKGGSRDGKI